jgi:iron complex transport system permease protein
MTRRAPPLRPLPLAVTLALALPVLLVVSVRVGDTGWQDLGTCLRGCLAALGWREPLPGQLQTIIELRLWRALTAAGVGASLGLAGALIQGLFRNGLASPSVLGVTGGASLGATLAILMLGAGSSLLMVGPETARVLVPLCGFVGAAATVTLVTLLATGGGRLSVPALLLTGIALNTCIAGILALISALTLSDWDVSRAILAWTFGTLDDRSPGHAATVWGGLLLAAAAIPFVAWELDLFQAGEDDARALGVNTGRVRVLCILSSSLAAATAVAVAGQIAFVGLVVPHLVRLLAGRGHRALLPLSLLLGAAFLLGVDLGQRLLLGRAVLPPGVLMSLIGGPFFLLLLFLHRREIDAW